MFFLDVEFIERDFDHFSWISVELIFAELIMAVSRREIRARDASRSKLNLIAAIW